MEKDIGKLEKNPETDIIVRVDTFGGKAGLTIREFVHSERYTGFTKAGVRIKADDFDKFKDMINAIDPKDLVAPETEGEKLAEAPDDDDAGVDEDGFM
jgi:hypothetical protein